MRQLSLVSVTVLLLTACGGAEKSAFEGSWRGSKSIGALGASSTDPTAFVPDMLIVISDDGHGALQLNGFAPAQVTSPDTFRALPVTYQTIFGPGYQGPGDATTSVTGGVGRLTGSNSLIITLTFSENTAGIGAFYEATYDLQRQGNAAPPSSL